MRNKQLINNKLFVSVLFVMVMITSLSMAPLVNAQELEGTASVTGTCGIATTASGSSIAFGEFLPTDTTPITGTPITLENSGTTDATGTILGANWFGTTGSVADVMPVGATSWGVGATATTALSTTAAGPITVLQTSALGVAGTTDLAFSLTPSLTVQNYNGGLTQAITLEFTCGA